MNRKCVTAVDIALVGAVLVVALVVWWFPSLKTGGKTAVIRVNDTVVDRMDLDREQQRWIDTETGSNLVVVQNGACFVAEADCKDGVCVSRGKISKAGESIVCLPHRLIVEIE